MKKFYQSCILGVCLTILVQFKTSHLYATHAQGADISYQCLGGSQYRVTVSFYRDCSGNAAPGSVTVNVSSASCGQNFNITLNPVPGTGQEVTSICAAMVTTCDGGAYPGVQEWEYAGNVTLPAACTDWVFGFTLCCRNNAISTIDDPGADNIYVEAHLDNLNYPCNNSPVFSNPPVPFICVGQTYCFNHGATDADGDSLVYSLITPMTDGGGGTVTYLPGWSATAPISSLSPTTINPLTGDICMTPQNLEVTVMAVNVQEWRDGVMIGSVVRDIQVRVINCTNNLPTITGINGTTDFQATVCAGSTLTFNIFSSDDDAGQNLTVTWNGAIPTADFATAGTPHPTATFSWTPTPADISTVPYCFTVTVTDDACPYNGSQTFAFCLTVTGLTVDVTPTSANCGASNGSASSLVVGGTAPYTYAWSSGATTFFDTGLPAGNYNLTVTDNDGCTGTDNFTIGAGSMPGNINFNTTDVLCYGGSSGQIEANVTGGGGPYTYSWSNGGNTSIISDLTAGTYTLTVTTAAGCTSVDSITINQPASALNVVTLKTDVTCYGMANGTAGVNISGGTPPYNVAWSTGSTATNIMGLTGGSYSCTVMDANGCGDFENINIVEPNAIVINSTLVNDVTCQGLANGNITLMASGGTGALGITWATTPVQTGNSAINLGPGAYTYTITDANGCTLSNAAAVTEPTALTLTATPTDISCNGAHNGSIYVLASGGTGPYNLSVSGSAIANGGTITNMGNGNYLVQAIDNHGCSVSDVVIINEPLPVSLITSPNLTICPGENVTVYAYTSGGTGTYTYNWNMGLGNSGSHVVSPGMTTMYTVTVTDQNGCSSLPGGTIVAVNDINNIVFDIVGNQPICKGDPITLEAEVTNGMGTYTFSWNSGALIGPGPFTFSPSENITYTVSVTDICGNSLTEYIPVIVHELPLVALPPVEVTACGAVQLDFSNSEPVQAGDEYTWEIEGNTLNGHNVSHTFSASGNYTIELTVENVYGCKASATTIADVTINPNAVAVIDAVKHVVGEFTPDVQFINHSLFANVYHWDFGDGATSIDETPHHLYESDGVYLVKMMANNQYNCPDTVMMEITVRPEPTLYVPNAFTPDGDGKNDLFMAKGTHIEEFELLIFDRWGTVVFKTNNLMGGWDGTVNGEQAKEDVYVYKIQYKTNESEVLTKEGHLSLLK